MLDNPCFGYINDIADLSSQYFNQMNLHFFGHLSVYPDGQFSALCSGHDWPEAFFIHQKIPPVGFTIYEKMVDSVKFPSMESGSDFGWSNAAVIESKERFGILNPMIIIRKYDDHYDAFVFDLHCKNVYQKYINNFDIFEKFTHYHKDKSKKMIDKVNKNPFTVDEIYMSRSNNPLLTGSLSNPLTADFNNQLALKRFYLRHNNTDIALSAKEYQCLALLAHGGQFKIIAAELDIAVKTVETHWSRIKQKLNLTSRNEIIAVYWNSRLHL